MTDNYKPEHSKKRESITQFLPAQKEEIHGQNINIDVPSQTGDPDDPFRFHKATETERLIAVRSAIMGHADADEKKSTWRKIFEWVMCEPTPTYKNTLYITTHRLIYQESRHYADAYDAATSSEWIQDLQAPQTFHNRARYLTVLHKLPWLLQRLYIWAWIIIFMRPFLFWLIR